MVLQAAEATVPIIGHWHFWKLLGAEIKGNTFCPAGAANLNPRDALSGS